MFLCKRVRSEVGVDSVGVGGGEPGGPAGGALRLVVTCPSTSPPVGPARVGGRVLLLGALRGPAVHGCCRSPATAVRAAASSEGKWPRLSADRAARWLGDSDGVGGAEVTRRRAGGKARKGMNLSQALSRARRRLRVLAGPGRTGGRRLGPVGRPPRRGRCRPGAGRWRPPCGPRRRRTARVARIRWTTQVGTMGAGPGPPRAASGRPAGPSQHTISTPLARPCWPDRRTRGALQGGPLPVLDPDPQHVLDAVHAPRPRRCGFGRPRHPVVGADLDADRVEADHRVEGHPEAGAATP